NGSNVTCSKDALSLIVNGGCGGDNNKTFTSMTPGPVNLCHAAGTITEPVLAGPTFDNTSNTWTWTCGGLGGALPASCQAFYNPGYIVGKCGSADGAGGIYTYSAPPPSNTLCAAGTASTPYLNHTFGWSYSTWHWSCTGTNPAISDG